MDIEGQTVFVTGANRGIGRAFVEEFLARRVSKVYAGARNPDAVDPGLSADPRVEVVPVDITDASRVAQARKAAPDVSVLVNNAGVTAFDSLLTGSFDTTRAMFETNVYGSLQVARAFAPILKDNNGAMVNVLSAGAWFSAPNNGAYGAAKSALWSITNGIRMELADSGVLVQGLHFGAVDTDFSAGYDGPKIAAHDVARASVDGIRDGAVEVLVDDASRAAKAALAEEPNAYARQLFE